MSTIDYRHQQLIADISNSNCRYGQLIVDFGDIDNSNYWYNWYCCNWALVISINRSVDIDNWTCLISTIIYWYPQLVFLRFRINVIDNWNCGYQQCTYITDIRNFNCQYQSYSTIWIVDICKGHYLLISKIGIVDITNSNFNIGN